MPANEAYLLVVKSVTNAMKGQKILESNGINSYVQRNTSSRLSQGCGYALKVYGNPTTASALLSAAGIKVSEIQGA